MSYKDSFLSHLTKNEELEQKIRKDIEDRYKLFYKDFGKTLNDIKFEYLTWPNIIKLR